jgi:hypothetical protein
VEVEVAEVKEEVVEVVVIENQIILQDSEVYQFQFKVIQLQ